MNELVGLSGERHFSYSYLHEILYGQARGFLSDTKQWCPQCCRERLIHGADENGVYDDLYWSVDAVKHCLLHGIELRKKCPKCSSLQPYISTSVEPGYCHNCLHFLGNCHTPALATEKIENLNEIFTLFYMDTYEGVRPTFVSLVENLKALKRAYPQASNKYLGDLMGVSEDVVKKWMSGKRKPQVNSLFLLYKALGLYGPHQLFYPTEIFMSKVILSKALSLKFNARSEFAGVLKEKEIIDSFESMICGLENTISRETFALRHDVTVGFLMSRFGSYCERLTRAHEARLADLRENRKKDLVAQFTIALGRIRSRKKKWTISNAIDYLNDPGIVEGFTHEELFIPFSKAKVQLRENDTARRAKQKIRKWD